MKEKANEASNETGRSMGRRAQTRDSQKKERERKGRRGSEESVIARKESKKEGQRLLVAHDAAVAVAAE